MDRSSPWLTGPEDHFTLTLHVQPGASHTEVAGAHGNALKIRLAASPVDGKANEALIVFLAEVFGVPKRHVELISGHASRSKRVRITGATLRPSFFPPDA